MYPKVSQRHFVDMVSSTVQTQDEPCLPHTHLQITPEEEGKLHSSLLLDVSAARRRAATELVVILVARI